MGEKIRDHVRSNVWGMAAMFVALTGPSSRILHHIHSGVVSTPGASRSASAPRLLRRAGVVLGLGLVVVLAGSAGSASAAVAALQRVDAESASNSSSPKSVTKTCPAGKQVTGAAGNIAGGKGIGQVVLRQVRPNAALTSVTVQAAEDQNGYADDWSLKAVAICATPPAGLERVSATSASDSLDKSVTATCPAGKRLLGTGGELAGGGGQVALNDLIPPSGLGSVTVRALEDGDGTTANWSVTAHAICSNPVAGRERVVATTGTDSTGDKGVGAPCPPGKQLTGVGGEIGGGGGEVVLNGLFANPNFVSELAGAGVEAREDEDGTASNWFARAFAICANSSQRVVARIPETGGDSNDKADLAPCPAGQQVTGGGGDITGGSGQVSLTGIFPGDSALTDFLAVGQEDGNDFAGNWSLRIYAICTTPLPGLELVSLESSPGSGDFGFVDAACPVGKRLVGVGGGINGGDGQVVLDRVFPDPQSNLQRMVVAAFENENGFANDWSLTAHAICATPPAGLELVAAASDQDSVPASVTATCPAGKNLLGAAGQIPGGLGEVVMDDLRPNALLTSVTLTGLEDETGYASDWLLVAYAICANA
jgi:hypothetical protein